MTFTGQSGESADTLFNGANDTLSSSIQSGDFLLSLQSANNTIFSTATVDTGELGSYSVSTHSPTASPFNESGGSSTCNIHATMRHVDQRQSGSTVCPSGLTTCSSDLSGVSIRVVSDDGNFDKEDLEAAYNDVFAVSSSEVTNGSGVVTKCINHAVSANGYIAIDKYTSGSETVYLAQTYSDVSATIVLRVREIPFP